eukprot:9827997-Alexandrium_andersonii.AAC.1
MFSFSALRLRPSLMVHHAPCLHGVALRPRGWPLRPPPSSHARAGCPAPLSAPLQRACAVVGWRRA